MKRQQNVTIWYQKTRDLKALAVYAQAHKIVLWSEDWSQLHLVAAKRGVVEHSVTRVDAVVAVIVHDYEVAR